jgi:hypothetical protein
MNPQNDKSPLSPNLPASLLPAVPVANGSATATSGASDRLYQFAALTVGAFLLATML